MTPALPCSLSIAVFTVLMAKLILPAWQPSSMENRNCQSSLSPMWEMVARLVSGVCLDGSLQEFRTLLPTILSPSLRLPSTCHALGGQEQACSCCWGCLDDSLQEFHSVLPTFVNDLPTFPYLPIGGCFDFGDFATRTHAKVGEMVINGWTMSFQSTPAIAEVATFSPNIKGLPRK